MAWNTSQGIMLMGGKDNPYNTTLLLEDGSSQQGFDLVERIFYSCAIEDPKSGTVIITGGDDENGVGTTNVIRYGEQGFIENLPKMLSIRTSHGCAGYYDEDGMMVLLVSGGWANPTGEMLVVGNDAWEYLGRPEPVYNTVTMVTFYNDVFKTGILRFILIVTMSIFLCRERIHNNQDLE